MYDVLPLLYNIISLSLSLSLPLAVWIWRYLLPSLYIFEASLEPLAVAIKVGRCVEPNKKKSYS